MLLEGKVAAIVGVGPGLGRAAALALADQGANVALSARTTDTAEKNGHPCPKPLAWMRWLVGLASVRASAQATRNSLPPGGGGATVGMN